MRESDRASRAQRRRAPGEGSIVERADGRWMVRVDLGRGADGRRRRKTAYADSQAEAVLALKRLAGRAVDGRLLVTSTPSVATFLEEWYRTNQDNWRESTRRGYRGAIDGHLAPLFGPLRLEQLTPRVIQRWLTDQKETHGARRRIALAHAVLRSALGDAARLQLVTFNAAALVKVPRPPRRPIAPLTVDQARAFLAAADGHRLEALFSVALACGLRLGEATGLQWADVDLDAAEIRIRHQLQAIGKRFALVPLKTKASRRTLVLPATCESALRAHRTRQLEQRLKAGPDWQETGFVFTIGHRGAGRRLGTPIHPLNVRRTLRSLLAGAGLPMIRFHDLRHSAASLLLAAGVQLAEVSKVLGHSEVRLTNDLYAHLQRETAARAALHMDVLLAKG